MGAGSVWVSVLREGLIVEVEVVGVRRCAIFALAIDIVELISSAWSTSTSISESSVVALRILASRLDISSSFHSSCSCRSCNAAVLSALRGCAPFRISVTFCSSFVRCSLYPLRDEISLFNSAIVRVR